MAKISANGATKVAEVRATRNDSEAVFVMCSDGRVLAAGVVDGRRLGYKLRGRVARPEARTGRWLTVWLERNGWEVTSWWEVTT